MCVVKHGLVALVVIMILKDTATVQVLFIVSLFCAWNITTVEINSGVHLLKSLIHINSLFTSGGFGLVILVLVLVGLVYITGTCTCRQTFSIVCCGHNSVFAPHRRYKIPNGTL